MSYCVPCPWPMLCNTSLRMVGFMCHVIAVINVVCVSFPGSSCGPTMLYCPQCDRLWDSFYFQAWGHQGFCDPPLRQKCRLCARSKKVRGRLCRSPGWPLLFAWESRVFVEKIANCGARKRVMRAIDCSCRRWPFYWFLAPHGNSQLSVTLSGIWCPLLPSSGTALICYTYIHLNKEPIHTK